MQSSWMWVRTKEMCAESFPRAVPEFVNQEREKVDTPEGVDSGGEGVDTRMKS